MNPPAEHDGFRIDLVPAGPAQQPSADRAAQLSPLIPETGWNPSDRPLWIAQLAPPVETVPPHAYGGTERVVSVLTEALVRRGHEVTLFASGDSRTSARLIPTVDTALWHHPRYRDALPFMLASVDRVYGMSDEFDIIHNHLGYLAYPSARACKETPTVSTLHGRLDMPEWQPLYRQFAGAPLVSISDAQRRPLSWANWLATVYHGIAFGDFGYRAAQGTYLAFLGRISPEKGLDTAIAVARRTGIPLRIAARLPLDQPDSPEARRDWRYFEELIRPQLDTPGIEYVGEVGGAAKSDFLGGALALLFPIRWPEPFGLVMAEALVCGTPVVALRQGSVPEVIEHGEAGFVVDNEDELVGAIARVHELDRARCRAAAEQRFSPAVMTNQYEIVYRRLIAAQARESARRLAAE